MLNVQPKENISAVMLIGMISTLMLISCASFGMTQKKFENKIITYQVKELKKPYPKERAQLQAKEKIEISGKGKFEFISAKKAFEAYKNYPGAKQVIMALPPTVSSVLSSSQALESLKPAMWWGVKLDGGGGVYPDATVAAFPGDFWNLDVVFNCTNHFEEQSMTPLPERACFSGLRNTSDIYYGLESPSFPTGGPNGIMQFEFSSGTSDTFLGVFSMSGDSENVELYVDETLVATYNVTRNNEEYAFLVDLPAGRHFITAIYTSTSSNVAYPQLVYRQLLLYRI
jgi:hypothetical protein